jgi:hypothetical protein
MKFARLVFLIAGIYGPVLYLQNRVNPTIFIPASLDLVLLVLFIAAYRKTAAPDSSRS